MTIHDGVIGFLYVENSISDKDKPISDKNKPISYPIRTGLLDRGKMTATGMVSNREVSCRNGKNVCFLPIKFDAAGQSVARVKSSSTK